MYKHNLKRARKNTFISSHGRSGKGSYILAVVGDNGVNGSYWSKKGATALLSEIWFRSNLCKFPLCSSQGTYLYSSCEWMLSKEMHFLLKSTSASLEVNSSNNIILTAAVGVLKSNKTLINKAGMKTFFPK